MSFQGDLRRDRSLRVFAVVMIQPPSHGRTLFCRCEEDAPSATDAGGAVNLRQWMRPGLARYHGHFTYLGRALNVAGSVRTGHGPSSMGASELTHIIARGRSALAVRGRLVPLCCGPSHRTTNRAHSTAPTPQRVRLAVEMSTAASAPPSVPSVSLAYMQLRRVDALDPQ